MCYYINAILNRRIDLAHTSKGVSAAYQFINVPDGALDEIVTPVSTPDVQRCVFTELWSGIELCLTLVIADVSHAVLTRDVVPVSASRQRYRLC